MCALVPRVQTRVEVLLVRHVRELRRPGNTGRLVRLALPRADLVDYGAAGPPFDDPRLHLPGTWLLFPDSADTADAAVAPMPRRLVVLDASWSQARKMMQHVPALRQLPRWALPAPASAPRRLRRAPPGSALSTIEAVARALERLEGPAVARPLDDLLAEVVRRSAVGHERGGPPRRS